MSIRFTDEEIDLMDKARKLFPHEFTGFNYDEWESIARWKAWLEEKFKKAEEEENHGHLSGRYDN